MLEISTDFESNKFNLDELTSSGNQDFNSSSVDYSIDIEETDIQEENDINTSATLNENLQEEENENSNVTNCLALTVKKDYDISVIRNVFVKAAKNTWRVILSVVTLSFLEFLL